MKSIVVSFFNSHNLGDVLISEALYNLADKYTEATKYSYSGKPLEFTDLNDLSETSQDEEVTLKQKFSDKLSNPILSWLLKGYRFTRKKLLNYPELKQNLIDKDLMIIGGGNMIFDVTEFSDSAFRFDNFVSLAKRKNLLIYAISIGIGPFVTEKQEIKAVRALEKCDYVTFRDQKSYSIYLSRALNGKNASVSIDPVFGLENKNLCKSNTKKIIGVNIFDSRLIGDNQSDFEKFMKNYIDITKRIIDKTDYDVFLFSTDTSDYKAINYVNNHIGEEYKDRISVVEVNSVKTLLDLYGKFSLLLGTRMHAMIIAYTQTLPIIGISWQSKVDALFDIIDRKDDLYNYKNLTESKDSLIINLFNKLENIDKEKLEVENKMIDLQEKIVIDDKILQKITLAKNNVK